MKLLGVVTAYHPEPKEFVRNIKTYVSGLDHLIIWDNTPTEKSELSELFCGLMIPNLEIRTTGQNEYLAMPFNRCIAWGKQEGFTHILTMDQDSFFEENNFEAFVSLVAECNDPNVMVFTSAKSENQQIMAEEIEVENAITSGTIYKLEVFEKIGYFREDFLIYMIDIEFGMRVCTNGFKIICFPQIILNHYTGYARMNNLGLKIDNYSAQSTYYIIRNVMLNWKLYSKKFSRKEKLKFFKYKIGYRTIKLPFEKDSFSKFKAIYIAFFHGLIGKSGRYDI
jgi:rhamnosyltransferase